MVSLQHSLEKQQAVEQTEEKKKSKSKLRHNTGTNKQVGENIQSRGGSEQKYRHVFACGPVAPVQLSERRFKSALPYASFLSPLTHPGARKHRCWRRLGQRRTSWSPSGREMRRSACSRWTRSGRRSDWLLAKDTRQG